MKNSFFFLVALRLNWSLSSQSHIGEGKKARGGQFPAYFLLPHHTRVLFISHVLNFTNEVFLTAEVCYGTACLWRCGN